MHGEIFLPPLQESSAIRTARITMVQQVSDHQPGWGERPLLFFLDINLLFCLIFQCLPQAFDHSIKRTT